jgi:peptidoglycan hydrolase CwlO-like protein
MNPTTDASLGEHQPQSRVKSRPNRPGRKNYVLFFISWFMLIAIGVMSTMLYANHLKEQIKAELGQQTEAQLLAVKQNYETQLDQLKSDVTSDIAEMQKKIDTFNELLAFTKDSANSKTDNSNQLYTQLAEVKQKLDELKKNLDVLK